MRPRIALTVSLVLGLVPFGVVPAQPSLSFCGGVDAFSLDSSLIHGGLSASIALADLDRNGTLEILSGDSQGYVHIWNADGSRFKHWPKRVKVGGIFGSPSVGDIDGDGRLDVVATAYSEVAVYAWRASGGSVRTFPKRIETASPFYRLRGGALLADLNADDLLDVVVGAVYPVHAFTFPFRSEVPGWPAGALGEVSPTSADLDHDGSPEVVLGGGGAMAVYRADGSLFPGWPAPPGSGSTTTTPVLGDLDGDGTPEVIVAAVSTLTAWQADGTPLFTTTIVNDYFNYSSIALGDVTGDGQPEIFVGTDQGRLYAFTGTGALLPGWPIDTGDDLGTSPLIVDLNGDGAQDVLVLATDGTLHALGENGVAICPPVTLPGWAFASPAVGDLDGDGLGEVIVPTYQAGIFRVGLPGPWAPPRAVWPMALANERHTGELR